MIQNGTTARLAFLGGGTKRGLTHNASRDTTPCHTNFGDTLFCFGSKNFQDTLFLSFLLTPGYTMSGNSVHLKFVFKSWF